VRYLETVAAESNLANRRVYVTAVTDNVLHIFCDFHMGEQVRVQVRNLSLLETLLVRVWCYRTVIRKNSIRTQHFHNQQRCETRRRSCGLRRFRM
jgi:hypothetical protein